MARQIDLLQGTLDLLILKTLMLGPLHGWGIASRIRRLSGSAFTISQGSLYPALYRLEESGWLDAEWGTSEEGKRAKFYRLTAAGRKRFAKERDDWSFFQATVQGILDAVD